MKKISWLALFTFLLSGSLVWAETGADILRAPILARAISLGGAYSGLADDVNAMLFNPAGISRVRHIQLSLAHNIGLIDALEYFAVAQPIRAGGTMGASLVYRHMPDIDNESAIDTSVTANDLLVTLSYALQLNYLSTSWADWSVGINVKWLRSTLGEYSPTAIAVDLGMLWNPTTLEDLKIGLSYQNLGTPLKFVDVEDNLPQVARFGVAYRLLNVAEHQLNLSTDGNYVVNASLWNVGVGTEYWFQEMFALRCGYLYQKDSLASVVYGGVGIRYPFERFYIKLDYAFKPVMYSNDLFESEHFLSLTLGF